MSDTINPEELREAVRSVLSDRSGGAITVPGDDGNGFDAALWAEMAGLGWLGLTVPEAHGGLGLGLAHACVLHEELGRELASVPMLSTLLAVDALALHGDADVQGRWLPLIAAGECLAALALPDGGGLPVMGAALDGVVEDVAFADVAGILLLPARNADGVQVLAMVEAGASGLSIETRALVDLTRSAGRVVLNGVVPTAVLVPGEQGWERLADHAAAALACDAAGGADALLERTVEYLKVREQFGRPIGSFQALKHRAADWKVRIEAVKVLARHAGAALDEAAWDASALASGAKAYACDVYAAFSGDAVQLHGGIGFTWEHPCHLFLKRAKLSQQMFGGPAAHKDRVAQLVVG
ncbi:acyl-CoA/acyl-ACP dehydrogenase [Novosphingobium sp. ERN07]|uniref:acyl-CoA dehydrogenase family protein n=1 Tax=Novosphingobium sp. ERN07 TaxID=2726187 RepID=UPI001456A8F1|nr:acyl-CoA dehydrogenase family protein [Novosphingobium sp. ERN07]NLR72996.1 acyl-CoA/acyl-ACP dehydrogenase [Novosphingobium sp. ERN07]